MACQLKSVMLRYNDQLLTPHNNQLTLQQLFQSVAPIIGSWLPVKMKTILKMNYKISKNLFSEMG